MATITWKGAPAGEDEGPKQITWFGTVFKKGEAVEVTNPDQIAKAQGNPFFEVSGAEEPPEKPPTVPAPSAMPAQYPVAKPGEPVKAPAAKPAIPRV